MDIKRILRSTAAAILSTMTVISAASAADRVPPKRIVQPPPQDDRPLHEQVKTDDPEINRCLGEAFKAVQIDGADRRYIPRLNALSQRKAQAVEYDGKSDTNTVGTVIYPYDKQDSGQLISFEAYHDGSLTNTPDAVKTAISISFNSDTVTERSRVVLPSSIMSIEDAIESPHGTWTLSAAQTMEATFVTCMELKNPDRPASASTGVGQPPAFMLTPLELKYEK